jgi:hypothetical protein
VSVETEKRIKDWYLWWFEHRKTIPTDDIAKRQDFVEKGWDGLWEVMALIMRDIQKLEHRDKSPSLYLPRGMSVRGDLTKLG